MYTDCKNPFKNFNTIRKDKTSLVSDKTLTDVEVKAKNLQISLLKLPASQIFFTCCKFAFCVFLVDLLIRMTQKIVCGLIKNENVLRKASF